MNLRVAETREGGEHNRHCQWDPPAWSAVSQSANRAGHAEPFGCAQDKLREASQTSNYPMLAAWERPKRPLTRRYTVDIKPTLTDSKIAAGMSLAPA